jgi:regulator of CtrA degradation
MHSDVWRARTDQLVYANHAADSALRHARDLIALSAQRARGQGTSMRSDGSARDVTRKSFTGSALFERTFDEGMALVEETAKYLDGRGRTESRDLPRKAAMLYAGESMRVTTRLMQAASWLLVQRAVYDGDMAAEDASSERYRLGSKEICLGGGSDGVELLPAKLRELLSRSDNLYRRIARLDEVLCAGGALPVAGVHDHFDRLEKAFGGESAA